MRRLTLTLVLVAISAVLPGASLGDAPAGAQECSDRIDEGGFATETQLANWNQVMSDLGARPTGSPAHDEFISWLEARLGDIETADGQSLEISTLDDTIDRWLGTGSSITLDPDGASEDVPVAAPVPYSEATSVSGELVYLPPEASIAEAEEDLTGKVIVRDVVSGVIQMPVFFAVAYYIHDPDASFDYSGNYERDWISAGERVADLGHAADRGAAGVVFAHEIPHAQAEGDYVPYNGVFWDVPAVYVGVDQGEQLKAAAAAGSSVALTVGAEETPDVPTRSVLATLPGQSDERIVISSHTDGVNAVWDNGPIGILALARYFASLPLECRPRTIVFAFTTAHLYLSQVGAERYAEELDEAYDDPGTVAFAVVLEHLGANEFVYGPRESEELPGRELEATELSELFAIFVHESPVTLQAVTRSVIERDLRRSWILRGADAPDVRFPPHQSYGGEGGSYHGHLIPTVAAITGPATLFKPNFSQGDLLDVELMRRQTMAFGDVILQLDDVPRAAIAGADTLYRLGRDATEGE